MLKYCVNWLSWGCWVGFGKLICLLLGWFGSCVLSRFSCWCCLVWSCVFWWLCRCRCVSSLVNLIGVCVKLDMICCVCVCVLVVCVVWLRV